MSEAASSGALPDFRRWATELVVVALGVFLGLAGESWADQRRDRAEAEEILGVVMADLHADSVDVASALRDLEEISEDIPAVIEALAGESPDLDRALALAPFQGQRMNPKLRFRAGGYGTLVSGGRLAALPPELAAELSNLYEFEYARIYDIREVVEFVVNEYFNARELVWNSATGETRPGADLIGLANKLGKYGGVGGGYLRNGLQGVEVEIGATRAEIRDFLADT